MSDCLHYIFDFASEKAKNRFSIYKDGKGYLNFEVFDNGSSKLGKHQYKVSADISNWEAGKKYHIATSWKLNTLEKQDEMHLFINGAEIPNILRFGGRPLASSTDRFRTVKPEIIAGTIPKDVITRFDLNTTIGSNIVYSTSTNFSLYNINIGDSIYIFESGFGDFIINDISGTYLTLNQPMPTSLSNVRYSINKYDVVVSSEIDLFSNIAVSILSDDIETEIPGVRAIIPGYSISKNSELENILTLLGDALAGDQILIRTLGLNHRRIRNKIYLWGDSQNILKTQLPPPINLDEVKIYSVLLSIKNINTSTASVVGSSYVAIFNPTQPSNNTEGRILSIRITGGNVNFSTPVSVIITGISDDGITETLLFNSAETQNTINRWLSITNVEITVIPFSLTQPSISIEIKEAYSIINSDGNDLFPIIRYSWQTSSGTNLTGNYNVASNGYFVDSDIGSKLVIESPAGTVGTYQIISRNSISEVIVSPNFPINFSDGQYKVFNTTTGRSGFQNGFFTFEIAGQVNTPYNLPQGYYEFDYSAYLHIPFDPVNDINAYIGSDFNGLNQAKATIDELRILSKELTDVRIGETISDTEDSITTDYNSLVPFEPNRDTLFLCHFDNLPFENDILFYKIANKTYIQSANSVNSNFNQSIVINNNGIRIENLGYLSTISEGTIEFWVSPNYDTYNDPVVRYYFDASSAVIEEVYSTNNKTVELSGRASSIISVRLQLDIEQKKTNYYTNGSLIDSKTINLGISLPSSVCAVKVAYIPSGMVGTRISIYKDTSGYINFQVQNETNDFVVRNPVFWQRETWHKITATYKFNRKDNKDEMRLFVDGEEFGTIYFGSGMIFGTGEVFGLGYSSNINNYLIADINLTDSINEFYIGSTYLNTNIASSRIDNLKLSNKFKKLITIGGQTKDISYQSNLDVVYPSIIDLYTTYIFDFDKLSIKNEDFAILRDERYGIFNFIINVIDSFNIVSSNAKLEQIMRELILALKPAQSKVSINILD
jgi:hypothetical protein